MRFNDYETKMRCMFQKFMIFSDKALCTNPHTFQEYKYEMDQFIIIDVNSRQQE